MANPLRQQQFNYDQRQPKGWTTNDENTGKRYVVHASACGLATIRIAVKAVPFKIETE